MRHVVRRSSVAMFVLAVVLVLGASACGSSKTNTGASQGTNNSTSTPAKGGDFHTEIDAFEWTGNFDPTGEYLGDAQGIFSNLLIRTLMGYNHLPDAAGNEVIPDLAADEPEITDGDTTYTFTLRDGVKFGPPVSRDVTSKDVEYAFRSDDNTTLQGLVAAGFGVALTPLLAVLPGDDRVKTLRLVPKMPRRGIAVVWHRDRHRSPAARAFVEIAQEVSADVERELVEP